MTRKVHKTKSIGPAPSHTPHCWEDYQKHAALAYLLDGTVGTKNIELRRVYIERIMGMSDIHQRTLMSLIERRKKKGKTPSKKDRSSKKKRPKINNNDNPDSPSNRNEHNKPAKFDPRSPFSSLDTNVALSSVANAETPENLVTHGNLHDKFESTEQYFQAMSPSPARNQIKPRAMFSPGLGDGAEFEKQMEELREKNQQLMNDLKKSQAKEDDMAKQLEDVESNYRKEMMKVEASSRRREDESKEQYETRLASLRAELDIISQKYEQAQQANQELEGVKDEMDVMIHTKSMLAETTERLRTYKEKVQQLSDVKEALQKEEVAHSRSVDECLRLENELQALQPLKRQLEEYKTRAVDAEVRFTECKDELMKMKQKGLASSDTNLDLEALVQSQSEEIEELNQRLNHEEKVKEGATGLGEGMSELNPELKEEVFRLRNENEQLKAFASKREDDAVTKMEQDLEDTHMLAERFKSQFLSTKNELETAREELKDTQDREANLRSDLSLTKELLSQTQDSEAKLQSDLEDTTKVLADTEEREEQLKCDLSDTHKLLAETEDREAKLRSDLSDTQKLLSEAKEREANFQKDLANTQQFLTESHEREASLQSELSETNYRLSESTNEADELSKDLLQCSEEIDASKLREAKLTDDLSDSIKQAHDLKSQIDNLTERLGVCSNDLMGSMAREADLKNEVEELTQKHRQSEERGDGLSERLQQSCVEVDTLNEQVNGLERVVADWQRQYKVAEESAESLVEQLTVSKTNLNTMKETEKKLNVELLNVSKEAKEAKERIHQLEKQLESCIEDLGECRQVLLKSQEIEQTLRGDLADMTSRAEDAEAVSKQRMELVQSTREKLKAAREENVKFSEERDERTVALQSVTDKHSALKVHADKVQRELADSRDILEQTENNLKDSQRKVTSLEKKLEKTETDCEDWKGKSLYESRLNEQLREELVETREVLSKAQSSVKILKDNEAVLKEELDHAEQMMFELEDSVEEQRTAKENLEKDFESTRQEKAKMIKDLESQKEKLGKKLNEEIDQSNKYKQELFSAQETVNETQSSLGASQHREKMLKHEVSKLQDEKSDLQTELETAKRKTEEAIQESTKSMENSCDALNAKAQKEYEELQFNMNQLLEDERKAKRRDDENHKDQIQQIRVKYDAELKIQKNKAEDEVKTMAEQSKSQIEKLKREFDEKMQSFKSKAALEKDQMILKGKGMLTTIRIKAKEELDEVKSDYALLQEKFDTERKEKEYIAQKYQEKVSEYKKKLQLTTSRINILSENGGELEEKVTTLEREKMKLLEENDRYRRQMGGRFGSDSKLQNQLEKVQKEFRAAIDEIQLLRKQRNQHPRTAVSESVLPPIDEDGKNADQSYSRDAVNQSTLVQLRTEYEETIEALNDEKRELVMKNSAAITDVQKAEKRAWESEQQNSDLQQELTSLKLKVERFQHKRPDGQEDSINATSFQSSREVGGQLPSHNTSDGILAQAPSLEESSDIISVPVHEEAAAQDSMGTKSFVDLHSSSQPVDKPGECQQS